MEYFEYLVHYGIIVCRKCQYAVLPSRLDTHLASSKHRLKPSQRGQIRQEITGWPNLLQNDADLLHFKAPTHELVQQIPALELHRNGRRCHQCHYITCTEFGIQQHYREQHQWNNDWSKGPKSRDRKRAGLSLDRPWRSNVHCQRFFTTGKRQEYFEVLADGLEDTPETATSKWSQAKLQLIQSWDKVQAKERRTIQAGLPNEVNQWLTRTGWEPYLADTDRAQVMQSVCSPQAEKEPVNVVIWEIMDGLIRRCQHSVIHSVGIFVRLEAIRTEKHQNRYHPLQPYMDAEGFAKYARPWKQILMFIAHTQEPHTWKSPPYQLTKKQLDAWQDLVREAQKIVDGPEEIDGDDSESEITVAQKACLTFCCALLEQRITRREYDSALVCALAVLGVEEDGWMGFNRYPPILSSMIKVSRFIVVQQALQLEMKEDAESADFVGCLTRVQRMMDEFMVRGSHSPMQWMLDLRTYGMNIHYNTTTEGHVDWQGDTVLYKKIQFNMGQFRGMVHGMVTEAKRVLFEEILFSSGQDVPPIPWSTLRDDPVNKTPGWNFTHDERNVFPVDGQWWLYNRIGQHEKLRRRFIRTGPSFAWNVAEVEAYMAWIVRFRALILVLIHVVGGGPARGPEILSIRHSNTISGEYRNMFIEDSMVLFVTRYHKGYATSGNVKIIHRYLPRDVGELWIWYMWLALPLQQKMEVHVWKKDVISSHMWPPDPAGQRWTSERMKKVIQKESIAGMGVELGIQSYRDLAIAISRRYLKRRAAFRRDDDDEDDDWDEDSDWILDEQTGHTSHVAGMVYARGITERDGEVASKRQQFRESSIVWHRFLNFPSDVEGVSMKGGKRQRAPFEEEYEEARMTRRKRLRATSIHQVLQHMMGDEARFRGVQEAGIKSVMAGESPVVVVMGTGSGKSLVFMLPAFCGRGGVSIVVVPLIALRDDLIARCSKFGITCRAWDRRQPPDAAQVVLVTPEAAVSPDFRTYINRIRRTQQLDRIVVDECHMVLNEQMNFRKQMQQLGELCGVGVQMVMLTATLPPSREGQMWRRMDFDADEVRLFRAVTRRVNIRYAVEAINGTDEAAKQAAVVRLVQEKMKRYPRGKSVVYASSVNKVRALAEALKCDAYYHHSENKDRKLSAFMEGQTRMIVATSALGLGIDIPDIRVIWHVDSPRTLLDYAQESGRAGRDGQSSEAVIIVGWGVGRYEVKQEEVELVQGLISSANHCRRAWLGQYLDGGAATPCEEGEEMCDRCAGAAETRRKHLPVVRRDEYNDPIKQISPSHTVAEAHERRESEIVKMQDQQQAARGGRVQERMRREGMELERLEQQLQRRRGQCPHCVEQGIANPYHALFRCQERSSVGVRGEYITFKESIRQEKSMERFSGCQRCFLPQAWCNGWEQHERQAGMYRRVEGARCEFEEVVLSGLIVKLGQAHLAEQMGQRMAQQGYGIKQKQEVLQYLGKRINWGGLEASQLLKEFYLLNKE